MCRRELKARGRSANSVLSHTAFSPFTPSAVFSSSAITGGVRRGRGSGAEDIIALSFPLAHHERFSSLCQPLRENARRASDGDTRPGTLAAGAARSRRWRDALLLPLLVCAVRHVRGGRRAAALHAAQQHRRQPGLVCALLLAAKGQARANRPRPRPHAHAPTLAAGGGSARSRRCRRASRCRATEHTPRTHAPATASRHTLHATGVLLSGHSARARSAPL